MAICRCHCHCCLTMGPVTGLKSLLATVIGATGSAWQKRWLHLSVLSPHDLQHLLDQPCVQHALYTIARPDSQFLLYMCVLSCMIFCGLSFSHILTTVMCMQMVHTLHVHSLRLAYIHLVMMWHSHWSVTAHGVIDFPVAYRHSLTDAYTKHPSFVVLECRMPPPHCA